MDVVSKGEGWHLGMGNGGAKDKAVFAGQDMVQVWSGSGIAVILEMHGAFWSMRSFRWHSGRNPAQTSAKDLESVESLKGLQMLYQATHPGVIT